MYIYIYTVAPGTSHMYTGVYNLSIPLCITGDKAPCVIYVNISSNTYSQRVHYLSDPLEDKGHRRSH